MRRLPAAALLSLSLALVACKAERTADQDAAALLEAPSTAIEAMTPDTDPAGAAAAIPPAGDARMDGYGAIDFGMTAEEARTDWTGNPLQPAGPAGDPLACHHLSPEGQSTPAELAFMFEDDLFVRYSVESELHTAPGGGRVGMDEAALQGLYGGRLQGAPHKYVQGGKVLMSPEDGGSLPSRLFFELDADGRVSSWRVGLSPQVGYVEGCS